MPMLQLYLQQASSNQSSHPDLSYNHAKGDILEMCNDSEIQSNAPFHSPSLVLKDLDILLSQITKRITMQLPANKIPSQVPIKKIYIQPPRFPPETMESYHHDTINVFGKDPGNTSQSTQLSPKHQGNRRIEKRMIDHLETLQLWVNGFIRAPNCY